MAERIPHLDCCPQPFLKTARRLRRTAKETESIRRCVSCGAHWYYHLRELASSGEEADRWLWCAALTQEETALALDRTRQGSDLAFLQKLAGWLRDSEGVRQLDRKPGI
ncbi:MAG: hypothetical protein AB9869_35275 [Verrucomicrobiia bacterium]